MCLQDTVTWPGASLPVAPRLPTWDTQNHGSHGLSVPSTCLSMSRTFHEKPILAATHSECECGAWGSAFLKLPGDRAC